MGVVRSVIWASLLSAGLLAGRLGWLSMKGGARR
jgi:hypothetical protein